jgi:hypothetical protein
MQKPTIQSLHENYYRFLDPSIMVVTQHFDKTTKEWKFVNYRCKLCDGSFKTVTTASKHHEVCKELNTIKKKKLKEKEMPIQVVTIKGERYYKWGDSGKPYKNRADAEKQARAAYASGYREPKEQMKDKNK